MVLSKHLTQRQVGERLGLTQQALGHWVKKPGCPLVETEKGLRILWPDFVRWRELELQRQARETAKPGAIADSQARKAAAEARRAELELARIEGSLVTVDYLAEQVERIGQRLRANLMAFPAKWAHKFVNLKDLSRAQAELQTLVRSCLADLSEIGDAPDLDEDRPRKPKRGAA